MVYGNIKGIKNNIKDRLDKLNDFKSEEFLSNELMQEICDITRILSREVCIYISRIGEVIYVSLGEDDRVRGRFVSKNVFCGDSITDMGDGTYICISCALQIEDVIGREFLIKTNDDSIVARAELLPRPQRRLDKRSQ